MLKIKVTLPPLYLCAVAVVLNNVFCGVLHDVLASVTTFFEQAQIPFKFGQVCLNLPQLFAFYLD